MLRIILRLILIVASAVITTFVFDYDDACGCCFVVGLIIGIALSILIII
jgi:hypothetical protein